MRGESGKGERSEGRGKLRDTCILLLSCGVIGMVSASYLSASCAMYTCPNCREENKGGIETTIRFCIFQERRRGERGEEERGEEREEGKEEGNYLADKPSLKHNMNRLHIHFCIKSNYDVLW